MNRAACSALLVCAGFGAACGDDAAESPRGTTPSARDAGGGNHPPQGDAGGPKEPEHELRSGDTYLCGYDDDDVFELPGSSVFGEVAIATDERGFALVHHDAEGALQIEAVAIAQDRQPSVRLIAAADAPGHAALAATDQRFALLYRAGTTLYARVLEPGATPTALTQRLAQPDMDGGERFALTALDDRFVAVWSEVGEGAESAVFVQAIDVDGEPQGQPRALSAVAQRAPRDLQLARLDGSRVLLAWYEVDDAQAGRVMAQTLDAELAPERDPVQLSKNAVAQARFDLGARTQSAGLIYQAREGGVRDTVKFRRVGPEGQAVESELNIVSAPGRARGGALAAFGQGYAIAYRVLPSLGVEQSAIRIAFVNQFGRVVYETELAPTSEDGGRATVAASGDGHLLVGWSTLHPSGGATTHAVQLDCPGALVLCGGDLSAVR